MADYKEIHGVKVQYRDSDATAIEGDVWYNATTGKLRMYQSSGSWATGGDLNTKVRFCGLAGTVSAAIKMGGQDPPVCVLAEIYDGSSWTEVADLNQGRAAGCAQGTTTAALFAGGHTVADNSTHNETEIWNGASWTEVGNLNTDRSYLQCSNQGSTTAGIVFGGSGPGTTPQVVLTEKYNGTAWTEVGDLNTARKTGGGGGTSTAAFHAGGGYPTFLAVAELWNGTGWTEVADLNTNRSEQGSAGITTSALVYGGTADPPRYGLTESYDGTSWTEVADLNTTRDRLGRGTGASNTSALAAGGGTPAITDGVVNVEEWSFSASVETVAFD